MVKNKNTINQNIKNTFSKLEAPYVLAVSGGPDSQCLIKSVSHVVGAKNCIAIGIDHNLREAAKRELDLAENLAKECGVYFERVSITVPKKASIQAQAREARYAALAERAQHFESKYIVTGHNYDDQVETLLIKLIRGTPPKRMVEYNYIQKHDITLVRPLLNNSRADIMKYIKRWNLQYAEDPSNKNPKYLRSWIRTELLPSLQTKNPKIKDNITQYLDTSIRWADEDFSSLEV